MPTHNLTTEHANITTLTPHPDNPRNGDTDTIAESLRVNGQFRPIVVARDGTILAGNHTYAAAMQLGWEQLDVVRLDVDPASDDAKAVMLADNRTADRAWYDTGLLVALLDELAASERGLAGTGYEDDDLDQLRRVLDAMELADSIGDGGTPYDGDKIEIDSNLHIVNVQIEKEHRAEFYQVVTSLPYVTDARDGRR